MDVANPEKGAMTVDDAVSSLVPAPEEDKPEPEAEAPQEAEQAEAEEAEVDEPDAEQAEGEEEAESEEAEPEESDAEPDDRFTVKIDGEEVEVTRDELLSGYQRDADYRRKTQALADDRRAIEREREEVGSLKAQLAEVLERQAQAEDQEPDWAKLAEELDPWEFQKQRAQWETSQKRRTEARQHAERIRQEQMREAAQREQAKLLERLPEWRDTGVAKKEAAEMVKVAGEAYGFSPDEVSSVLDHRTLMALRDAVKYRQLQTSKPAVEKKVRKAPKVQKPGATRTAQDRRAADRQAVRDNLRKRGSVDDAVAFLLSGDK